MTVTTAEAGSAVSSPVPLPSSVAAGRLLGTSEPELAQLKHGAITGPPYGVLGKANPALGLEMGKQHRG